MFGFQNIPGRAVMKLQLYVPLQLIPTCGKNRLMEPLQPGPTFGGQTPS